MEMRTPYSTVAGRANSIVGEQTHISTKVGRLADTMGSSLVGIGTPTWPVRYLLATLKTKPVNLQARVIMFI